MKNTILSLLYLITALFILTSCTAKSSDPAFLSKVEGRYLFNPDEVIKVHSKDNFLLLEWRGAEAIKPSRIDEDTYYVKEMNAKIQFLKNPTDEKEYLVFVPKDPSDSIEYVHKKLDAGEKIPSEYLANNNYEKALEGYLAIKKEDSLSPLLHFWDFDRKGRRYLKNDSIEQAINVFKLNVVLHPREPNAYVRLGRTYLERKDTIKALTNYKIALKYDSGNRRIKEKIENLEGKEAENPN